MIVPYPYQVIKSRYEARRKKLAEDFADYERKDAKNLFIDAFIEHECGGKFAEVWGGCSYPPTSIQSLLRILLIESVSLENKCVIFIYLFMDISYVLHETSYGSIVKNLIKFPTVFKINSAIIKVRFLIYLRFLQINFINAFSFLANASLLEFGQRQFGRSRRGNYFTPCQR